MLSCFYNPILYTGWRWYVRLVQKSYPFIEVGGGMFIRGL